MATPNTRTTFKEYCLRSLGKPVIEINVDPDQVEDRIDEALQYFAQYHYDGIERVYLKYQVTQADIDRARSDNSLATATDNSDPVLTIVQSPAAGTIITANTIITMSVTDSAGNVSTCTFEVILVDNTDPTITCAADVNTTTDADDCFATVTLTAPTTDDNCGVASVSNNAPATFPIGTTDVIWTVTDGAGNTSTCTQTVSVNDNELPNAVCQDLTVQLDATGAASITSAMIDNGSSDNCGIDNISISQNSFDCSDLSSGINS